MMPRELALALLDLIAQCGIDSPSEQDRHARRDLARQQEECIQHGERTFALGEIAEQQEADATAGREAWSSGRPAIDWRIGGVGKSHHLFALGIALARMRRKER